MHIQEKFDNALANKIRSVIEDHGQEAYEIGAWESFDASAFGSRSSAYKFLWVGLAASFLMAMFLNSLYTTYNDGVSSTGLAFENLDDSSQKSESVDNFSSVIQEKNFTANENKVINENEENQEVNHQYLVHFNGFDSPFSPIFDSENENLFSVNSSFIPQEVNLYKYKSGFVPALQNTNPERKCISGWKFGAQFSPSIAGLNNTGNRFGWSAGIVAELPVLKKLSFTSGLLISQQNINVSNVSFTHGTEQTRSRLKGMLIAFEVPLNLKYNIFKKKNKEISISAGVSSLAYIKEKFTGGSQNKNEGSEAYNRVEGVKFANMAVAMEVPVDKHLSILVEPFVKVPIGSTTSKEVKFSNVGVNFRLNYTLAKLL